jgi:hypothetical protein
MAASAAGQLRGFMAKYTPDIAKQGRTALPKLRRLMPHAIQLVYDNYNFLVVGFGPSEHASEAVLSLVFAPKWLSICFIYGKGLPDPTKLLRGGGNQVRFVRLESPKDIDKPAVRALIKAAVSRMDVPFDPTSRSRLVIRSISAKQRPRRPK